MCPYAIHVFDLTTDKVLRKYTLRPEDTNANTFIANIAIDIGSKGCEDTFLYASDELGYGLISYSWELNTSWRHTHSYLMPDPLAGDFNVGGKYTHFGYVMPDFFSKIYLLIETIIDLSDFLIVIRFKLPMGRRRSVRYHFVTNHR